jgi:glucose-1-phosphate cytidylyltransferase
MQWSCCCLIGLNVGELALKLSSMKAVILTGSLGTRLAEETHLRSKPIVEVGGKPILWHILKTYSHYGINEFVICCG